MVLAASQAGVKKNELLFLKGFEECIKLNGLVEVS